jgi:hypothetical protein
MIIQVTQDHIDKAKTLLEDRNNSRTKCCPLALAITDGLKKQCQVGLSAWWVSDIKEKTTERLPVEACAFRRKFDFDRTAEPFEFNLDI